MARVQITGDLTNDNKPQGGGFTAKTPGLYDLRIDAEELASSKAGVPKSKLSLTIVMADNGQHIGQKVTWHETHHPKMAWRMKNLLDASGVPYEVTPAGALDFDTAYFVGCFIRAELSHEQDKNDTTKTWERWGNLQPSRLSPQPGVPQAAQAAAPVVAPPQQQQVPAPQAPAAFPQAHAPIAQVQPGQGVAPPQAAAPVVVHPGVPQA
jgi:hypothetical protein